MCQPQQNSYNFVYLFIIQETLQIKSETYIKFCFVLVALLFLLLEVIKNEAETQPKNQIYTVDLTTFQSSK